MHPSSLLRAIACIAALILGSTACGAILESSATPAQAVLGGEAMRLQLSTTSVTEGQLLPLTVTLTNTSGTSVTYEGNTCPFNVYEVQDAAGDRIDPKVELILCAAYSQPLSLAPGASRTWSLEWVAARFAPARANRPTGTQTVRLRARYWVGTQLVASEWQSVSVRQAP